MTKQAQYFLSPNAARSLEMIKAYTYEKFGKRQERIYLKKLRDRFEYLAEFPEHSMRRDDIKKGYRSYFEGSHTIYYKIVEDQIMIIDVLHQSMEPVLHLE